MCALCSQIFFSGHLDIPTWEKETGEGAIQLSFVGTSPRLLSDDLASDNNFKGKFIIDVTGGTGSLIAY
jgi:hypothetical protein